MDDSERDPLVAAGAASSSSSSEDPKDGDSLDAGPGHEAPTRFVLLLSVVAAIGGFLFGYDTGVIGGAMLFIKDDFDLSPFEQEAVVSGATAGAMVGAAVASWYVDRGGRRKTTLVAAAVFVAGAAVMALAPGLAALLAGRVVVGVGIGLASTSVPVYLAEMAPPAHRGRLVTLFVQQVVFGQLVAYGVDSAFAGVPGGWRYMLGLSAAPALVQLAGMAYMPETPLFLARRGREAEARSVLRRVWGVGAVVTSSSSAASAPSAAAGVEAAMKEIRDDMERGRREASGTWRELVSSPDLRARLVVGVGLQACQQLAGINTAMYYSPTLTSMAGFSSKRTAILLADAVALANFAFTLLAGRLMDRHGRRRLLVVSLVGVALSMSMLGFSFYLIGGTVPHRGSCADYTACGPCTLDESCGWCGGGPAGVAAACLHGNSTGPEPGGGAVCAAGPWSYGGGCEGRSAKAGGWLAVASLVCFVSSFAIGIGSVPWAIQSEIFPAEFRGKANSLATGANWTFNLLVSATFLSFLRAVSPAAAFWSFAGVAALTLVFVLCLVPETKGLTLGEVSALFALRARGTAAAAGAGAGADGRPAAAGVAGAGGTPYGLVAG